jgi:hypothetical protein
VSDITTKTYTLLGADGQISQSTVKGTLGGNRDLKLYGRLDCSSALRALPGFAAVRVFFADESTTITAGYRPCSNCMKERFKVWRAGGTPGTPEYPWLVTPDAPRSKGGLT